MSKPTNQGDSGRAKPVKKLGDIFDTVLDALAILAGALLYFLMISIFFDVTLRFFFGRPLGWAVEFSEYTMLYIVFLGTAWVLRQEGHVAVDVVTSRLSPKIQTYLNIITSILGAIICLIITGYGVVSTLSSFQRGLTIGAMPEYPKWLLLGIIPLGSLVLAVQFARRAHGFYSKLGASEDPEQKVASRVA